MQWVHVSLTCIYSYVLIIVDWQRNIKAKTNYISLSFEMQCVVICWNLFKVDQHSILQRDSIGGGQWSTACACSEAAALAAATSISCMVAEIVWMCNKPSTVLNLAFDSNLYHERLVPLTYALQKVIPKEIRRLKVGWLEHAPYTPQIEPSSGS